MKRLLDGLYLTLGTFCLFGFPSAMLGFSALYGDQVMKLLHVGDSARHSILFQIEAITIVFGTSAGGLATAVAVFAVLWVIMGVVLRAGLPAQPPQAALTRTRTPAQEALVGHIDHGGANRRTRAKVA